MKHYCIATTRLLAAAFLFAPTTALTNPADELVERLQQVRATQGFRGHVTVTSQGTPAHAPVELRLLLKGRQDEQGLQLLYQVLWPKSLRGQALVLSQSATGKVTGFGFTPPDQNLPLSPNLRAVPVFNTGLSVAEVAEDFWGWPQRKLAGKEKLQARECSIVEFSPGKKPAGSFAKVRACIAPDILVPLRIEKYDNSDRLVISIHADKILQQGKRWVTSEFRAVPADGRAAIRFNFINGELDSDVPATAFTLDALRKTAATSAASGAKP